ncbi:hypothetical protein ACTFIY_010313 [Dictyostelium cf. discoideum]
MNIIRTTQTLNVQSKQLFRSYSSLTPSQHLSKKLNFPLKKKFYPVDSIKAVNQTRHSIFRARESLDRGLLKKAEDFAVSSVRDFMKKIDLSSSLYAYPTYALGLISLKKGYYSTSENLLRDSLSRSEAIDGINKSVKKNMIESTNDLGLALLRQGEYGKSFSNFSKAEEMVKEEILKKEIDLYFLLPAIYSNIGEYYREFHCYDTSIEFHARAHNCLLAYPLEQLNLVRCLLNRGQLYRISNQIEVSKEFLDAGHKKLVRYLNSIDSKSTPNHMDWSKFLMEYGHYYFSIGNIEKARKKFISAKDHFISMDNSETPDAIINMINLAIIEKKFPTLPSAQSDTYISEILASIQSPLLKLKTQRFNLDSHEIDSAIQSLVNDPIQTTTTATATATTTTTSTTTPNHNNNTKAASKNINITFKPKSSQVKLVEPLAFQLMFIESDPHQASN